MCAASLITYNVQLIHNQTTAKTEFRVWFIIATFFRPHHNLMLQQFKLNALPQSKCVHKFVRLIGVKPISASIRCFCLYTRFFLNTRISLFLAIEMHLGCWRAMARWHWQRWFKNNLLFCSVVGDRWRPELKVINLGTHTHLPSVILSLD